MDLRTLAEVLVLLAGVTSLALSFSSVNDARVSMNSLLSAGKNGSAKLFASGNIRREWFEIAGCIGLMLIAMIFLVAPRGPITIWGVLARLIVLIFIAVPATSSVLNIRERAKIRAKLGKEPPNG